MGGLKGRNGNGEVVNEACLRSCRVQRPPGVDFPADILPEGTLRIARDHRRSRSCAVGVNIPWSYEYPTF